MRVRSAEIVQQQPPAGRELPLPVQIDPSRSTPVFGTAQPTSGPAAGLRRQAYALRTHDPRHWLMLLAADRVEIGGDLARAGVTPGQRGQVLRHYQRQARSYPRSFAAAAALLGAALIQAVRGRAKRGRRKRLS